MELANGARMEEAKQGVQRGERKDREEGGSLWEVAGGSSQWYSRVVEHTPATVGIA